MDIQYTYFTPSTTDASSGISQIGDATYEDTVVHGLILNKTFKSLSFKNNFQAFYTTAIDTTARTGMDDAATPTINEGTSNLGDMTISGAMVEALKVNGNIDLFAHYAMNTAKPNGQTVNVAANGSATPNVSMGMLGTTPGTNKTISTEEKTGNAIWVGARYHINRAWKVGAEYNKGSENWFSYTTGSNDPVNKLAVRGTATELYVTKSINKYAGLRLGYIQLDLDYTNSGMLIGTPMDIDSAGAKAGGAIKKSSNTYISFNLLF